MLHYSRVIRGIANYIDAEIVGKLNGSWKAWVLGGAAGLAMARAEVLFRALAGNPIVTALGVIDGENVDVDAIMVELRKQAQRGNITVGLPIVGPVTFGLADVEALDRHIKGA